MKYYETKLGKFAFLTAVLGLTMLIIIMITQSGYPDILFQILGPIGVFLVFLSAGLHFLNWIFCMKQSIKSKDWRNILWLLFLFLSVLISGIIRLL